MPPLAARFVALECRRIFVEKWTAKEVSEDELRDYFGKCRFLNGFGQKRYFQDSAKTVMFPGGEIREIRLDSSSEISLKKAPKSTAFPKDKSKRSGTLFCHIEFAETVCVDRAIRLSGASWLRLRTCMS